MSENSQRGRLVYQFKSLKGDNRSYLRDWKKESLWMSDPANFNDPLDLKLKIGDLLHRSPYGDQTQLKQVVKALLNNNDNLKSWFYKPWLLEVIRKWVNDQLPEDSKRLITNVNECIAQYGVSCFTSEPNNPLMWSHYADHHSGYGVQYRLKEMELAVSEHSLMTEHVQYVSRLPELCLSEVLLSPHQTLRRMLATKSLHWSYEKEWRLISLEYKGCYISMPIGMEITGLIAGEKISAGDQELLKQKAHEFDVPLLKMKTQYGYELFLEKAL